MFVPEPESYTDMGILVRDGLYDVEYRREVYLERIHHGQYDIDFGPIVLVCLYRLKLCQVSHELFHIIRRGEGTRADEAQLEFIISNGV